MSTDATPGRGPASTHLEVAAANADLGLPIPRRTRFRFLKRSFGKLMWVFGRDQATYNHAMLEAVTELASSVEAIRTSVTEHVGNEVGSMRSQVGSLEVDVRAATGQLERAVEQLEDLRAQVQELAARLGVDAPTRSR